MDLKFWLLENIFDLWLWKASSIKEKFSLVENFFACGKFPLSWNKFLFVEKLLDHGKLPFLWKISLINEKSLFVENFHDNQKKKFVWKVSLIKKTFLFEEKFFDYGKQICVKNVFDPGKVFVCGKLSWLQKKMKVL